MLSCQAKIRSFTIQIQIKLGWALFVTYTIIQSIMRSEMCSLHLTHPSVHTWSSGQPTVQRPGSSRGFPAGAGIQTHNLGLAQVSSPTMPLGQRLPSFTSLHSSLNYGHVWYLNYIQILYIQIKTLSNLFWMEHNTGSGNINSLFNLFGKMNALHRMQTQRQCLE